MTDASPEIQESGGGDLELFEQYLDEEHDFEAPKRGDLVTGVVAHVSPQEILVDIGVKRDGVVPSQDIARLKPEFVEQLHPGDEIKAVVVRPSDADGNLRLSIYEALQQQDWVRAQELLESGEVTARVVEGYNKGGLTVEFGELRGFIPMSHLADVPRNQNPSERQAALNARVGQEVPIKVIEVDRRRRRLICSERQAVREEREAHRRKLFESIQVGDVIRGVVKNLRPFGAFVDIGGADGLVHVSELAWHPVNHPRDVLAVGDEIEVEVIRVDPARQRIGLSRKRCIPDPWDSVEERYAKGDIVPVTITRVVDFGAFASIESGMEGLIHISELADVTVAEPLSVVQVGDKVKAKVLRVDPRRRRIGLSLRQVPEDMAGLELVAEDEVAETEGGAAQAGTPEVAVPESVEAVEEAAPEPSAEAAADEPVESEAQPSVTTEPEVVAESAPESSAEVAAELQTAATGPAATAQAEDDADLGGEAVDAEDETESESESGSEEPVSEVDEEPEETEQERSPTPAEA